MSYINSSSTTKAFTYSSRSSTSRWILLLSVMLLGVLPLGIALFDAPIVSAFGSWTNGQAAAVVLGQPGFISNSNSIITATSLSGPRQVAVDPTTGKVFVSDSLNNRILRFSTANAAINGSASDAVLGQADFVSGSVNRGSSVLTNSLSFPVGIFVDSAGRLWVADQDNNRVLRYDNASSKANGADADRVLGQADFVSGASNRGGAVMTNTLNSPTGVWLDAAGSLWVGDGDNNRILRFDNAVSRANGANADGELGQPDFLSNSPATTQNGLNTASYNNVPLLTNSGSLFVSDTSNNRVLRYDNAASKANGANADGVLGQLLFTTNAGATSQSGMLRPRGVAFEEAVGRLYVTDSGNSRVLIFNNAVSIANGANADNVLGQLFFTSGAAATTQSGLNLPRHPFFDNLHNELWVADAGNNRVLRYDPATSKLYLPLVSR